MQNLQAAARAKCPACQPLLACEKTKVAPTKRRRRQPSLRQPPLDSIEYRRRITRRQSGHILF